MSCHVKDCISQRNRQNFSFSSHNKRRKALHIRELQKPHIFCRFHVKMHSDFKYCRLRGSTGLFKPQSFLFSQHMELIRSKYATV